jgi:hypothetical protein
VAGLGVSFIGCTILTFSFGFDIGMIALGSVFLLATSVLLLGLLLLTTTKGLGFLILATSGTGLLLLAKMVSMLMAKIGFQLLLTSGLGLLAKKDFFLLHLATSVCCSASSWRQAVSACCC